MNRTIATIAAVATLILLSAPAAQAQTQVTVTAQESCSGDKTFCYDISGPASFEPGETVNLTFVNPSSNSARHNVHVDLTGDYNADHSGTSADAAEHNTTTLRPGNQTTIEFTIPSDAEEAYLWCTVAGHESLGMWDTIAVEAPDTDDGMQDGDGDGDGQQPTPGFGAVAALAAAGVAAALLTRRSR